MIRRPPRSTRTDTLFPYTTLFLSLGNWQQEPISSPTPISPMPIFADNWSAAPTAYQGLGDRRAGFTTPPPQARAEPAYAPPPESRSFPLGVARGQVAKTYIVP